MENSSEHFIEKIIRASLEDGSCKKVITRFPPEPNGCLHIGHAKAICLDFGMAKKFGGLCNLRMDDTNPDKEDTRFVEAIGEDIKWLGWQWDNFFYASDYFDKMYDYAVELIKNDKAYACELPMEEFKQYRGTPSEAGKASPYRDRPVCESLQIFEDMKNGKYDESSVVIRAKIDMASPNIHMRDPVIYRIKKLPHHRTEDKWCIYPMYDFAHCIEDAIENVTHSLCTLEFEVHRPLYDWVNDNISIEAKPIQYEFARLNLSYTIMSKRKLQELVNGGFVDGWSDPRMPTVSGMRRRGYTASGIRNFCEEIGITKFNSLTELSLLEHFVRDDLNKNAIRRMAVFDPLKVVIENWDEGKTDYLDGDDFPQNETSTTRKIPFTKTIYIEKSDFLEDAPKKFFRLSVGKEVRLRYAYILKCNELVKDENGNIEYLKCTIDEDSRGGNAKDGRKIKGTIHWVSATENLKCPINLYENLFTKQDLSDLEEGDDFKNYLNPNSLVKTQAICEIDLQNAKPDEHFQFERIGYFIKEQNSENLSFNRTITLKDNFK